MGRQQKVDCARQGGFTIIELLVVMVIMAMAYTLAGPMVSSGVSGTELKASARQLAAGLRKARSDAISRRTEAVLTVDVEAHQFQLSGDQRVYQLPKSIAVKLFTAQSELVNGSTGAFRFFPDGGSTGGRITLSARDRNYDVDINWLTGQVAILD
ncbi:GspH/FimT family pseudopilin [Rhodoferax sp. AJA081-3]|uniref:GspH/FimT family pseudopilin n=1 Tax=Rhodoferax sp. AJA081-3 TaxID=2752316 RepID=UPI001ADFCABF|nr:GspH/FimT family pseudopilin [Rhodoferax sp. AJA081-3]QTN26118.1 GspH/FimT family pseudopilin [Rhodoferax sp. AJA081-3]